MIHLSADLQLDPAALVGKSIAILGIKGSGKSNTARCLIEDLLPDCPMTIIDPEGEYASLRAVAPILHMGKRGDLNVPLEQIGMLGRFAYQHKLSVILDLKGLSLDDLAEYVEGYLRGLWRAADETSTPYFLVLEEARLFAPQGSKATPLLKLLQDIQFRGRKRGVGMVVINQRTTTLDKNVLNQCEMQLLHRVVHQTDIKQYQSEIPGMSAVQVANTVRGLLPGQIVYVNGGEACVTQVRLPRTAHGGATPTLGDSAVRGIDAALLDQLRQALTSPLPLSEIREGELQTSPLPLSSHLVTGNSEGIADQRDELIVQLRAELAEARAEIGRLKAAQMTTIGEKLQQATLPIFTAAGEVAREAQERAVKREVQYTEAIIKRQRIAFNNLVAQYRAIDLRYRDLLVQLHHRAPETLDSRTLAHMLGLRPTSLDTHPPLALVNLGLIRRQKVAKRWLYNATARELLAQRFPALDTEELLGKLLNGGKL